MKGVESKFVGYRVWEGRVRHLGVKEERADACRHQPVEERLSLQRTTSIQIYVQIYINTNKYKCIYIYVNI